LINGPLAGPFFFCEFGFDGFMQLRNATSIQHYEAVKLALKTYYDGSKPHKKTRYLQSEKILSKVVLKKRKGRSRYVAKFINAGRQLGRKATEVRSKLCAGDVRPRHRNFDSEHEKWH
jgi:hypothetical protein